MADIVRVTWWDSYKEEFECTEVRYGSDLLWMRLTDGKNRHIPTRHIRWCKLQEEVPCPEVSERKIAGLEGPECRNTVTVRWWDGYMADFECQGVWFGADVICMLLMDGWECKIPARHVRWYSLSRESHEPYRKEEEKK